MAVSPDSEPEGFLGTYGGFSKIRAYPFGDPHNKDFSIVGSILGSPYSGKLPYGAAYWAIREGQG